MTQITLLFLFVVTTIVGIPATICPYYRTTEVLNYTTHGSALTNNADMCRFYDNNTLLCKANKNRMECSIMKLTFKNKVYVFINFFAES